MTLPELQKDAREKWGIEVGPNSTQRGQEKVLAEIIERAWNSAIDAALEALPEKLPKQGDTDMMVYNFRNGWKNCHTSIHARLQALKQ